MIYWNARFSLRLVRFHTKWRQSRLFTLEKNLTRYFLCGSFIKLSSLICFWFSLTFRTSSFHFLLLIRLMDSEEQKLFHVLHQMLFKVQETFIYTEGHLIDVHLSEWVSRVSIVPFKSATVTSWFFIKLWKIKLDSVRAVNVPDINFSVWIEIQKKALYLL